MMKKKTPPGRTLQEVRAAADKNWDRVKQDMTEDIVDRDAIIQAMSWLNDIDGEEMLKNQRDYMQRRKKWLIDPDAPCDDEEIEKNYQRLRQQYQTIYGKDPKYG